MVEFDGGHGVLRREELPVVTPAADRATGGTEDPEHDTDDEQDHPDGPKDADAREHADQQQDDASNDHETEEYRSGTWTPGPRGTRSIGPPFSSRGDPLARRVSGD